MNSTQIVTGKVRLSYCNLFTPKAPQQGGQEVYSTTILIPKDDKATLTKIKVAVEAAMQVYFQKNPGKKLSSDLKTTIHDGDGEKPNGGDYGPECAGCYVMTVSSKNRPVLVFKDKTPILDQEDLYSGCYARVIINFYVYDTAGNKGVSAGLNGVMKVADGEPLAGGHISDSDWDDGWEDEDDDLFT
jgi:hypothetical protein